MPAQRDAFSRVRRYLNYKFTAAWCAIVASVILGVLYVALIALVGLFADLVVEKGRVNLFTDIERAQFHSWLMTDIGVTEDEAVRLEKEGPNGVGLVSLAWRNHRASLRRDTWGFYHELAFESLTFPVRWFPWTRTNGDYLFGLLLIAVGLGFLRGGVAFGMHRAAATAVIEATTRLRRAVYHHAYRLGTLMLRAMGPTEAVGVFTRHLEAVHEGLYTWVTVVFREPAKFFLLVLFAVIIEPSLSLFFFGFALLVWLVGGQLAAYFRRQDRVNTQAAAEQMTLLHESITLMRLVKAYLMELFNQTRVERQLADYGSTMLRRYRAKAIYQPTLIFLAVASACFLFYAGGTAILNGTLSVAGTISLCATLLSLYDPIVTWLEQRRIIRRAGQSAGALYVFLDRRSDVGQAVGAEFLNPLRKHLTFDGVSLKDSANGDLLLSDVSLQVLAGQRVAIVSQEDREKHALVYLILRFLDPTDGEIRIDGHRLRWVTLDSLRSQIGLVLQNNLVFNDTVANNIGCGEPGYSLPQIIEAAKAAHAHQFIQRLPNGYKTPIGELGHSLNISEQFRIAFARAMLRDPSIVIIEEPQVTLDDDSKAMIDDAFAHFLPGRTTIFLPHRISTIRSCDRVFLIHKGRVQAAGEHRDLLSQSELYRHIQYMEFNVFAEQS